MSYKEDFKKALDEINMKLSEMTDEEFKAELEKNKDGDLARIFIDARVYDEYDK
jgi:tripartite-type tricarboxylate transporter receptor subunit TctC